MPPPAPCADCDTPAQQQPGPPKRREGRRRHVSERVCHRGPCSWCRRIPGLSVCSCRFSLLNLCATREVEPRVSSSINVFEVARLFLLPFESIRRTWIEVAQVWVIPRGGEVLSENDAEGTSLEAHRSSAASVLYFTEVQGFFKRFFALVNDLYVVVVVNALTLLPVLIIAPRVSFLPGCFRLAYGVVHVAIVLAYNSFPTCRHPLLLRVLHF